MGLTHLPPSHTLSLPSPPSLPLPLPTPSPQGIHNYLNFDQTKKSSADDYIRLPQMVADENARRALNRSPLQRSLDEEEKAFMRDTWEGVAEEDTPLLVPRLQMKLSLGDLEYDLLMKEIKKDEDKHDSLIFDNGDSLRPVRRLEGERDARGEW